MQWWVGKIALFGKASVAALVYGGGFANVCNVGWGFFVFLREGEKNKINSFKFALTYQRANPFLFQFYRYRTCLFICLYT